MTEPNDRPNRDAHWVRSPLSTRHSQATLLTISFFWGLSYCMPESLRIGFAEVFPRSLSRFSQAPMWVWGAILLLGAGAALFGERLIMRQLDDPRLSGGRFGWRLSIFSHQLLVGVYTTLAVGALVTGLVQVAALHWQLASLVSAISRPVLWGYIAFLHGSYSKLPTPFPFQGPKEKKVKTKKLRLFVRVPIEEEEESK